MFFFCLSRLAKLHYLKWIQVIPDSEHIFRLSSNPSQSRWILSSLWSWGPVCCSEAKCIIALVHVEHGGISQLAGMSRFTFWEVTKYDFVTRSIFSYFRQTWLSGGGEEMLRLSWVTQFTKPESAVQKEIEFGIYWRQVKVLQDQTFIWINIGNLVFRIANCIL